MSKKIEQRVHDLIGTVVTEMGYELVDVSFAKEGPNYVLTVFIDQPGGISLDDCEKVSLAIDPVIDEADPIEQSYYMSVSSIGLDRPLKTRRDYERNIGKIITVKLFAPRDKTKEFTGELHFVDDEKITIEHGPGHIEFLLKDIAVAKLYINFK